MSFTQKSREYIDKTELQGKDLEYYTKFLDEYYDNSVNKKNLSDQLHNTDELVKKVYDQTNSRNRDLLSLLKVTKKLDSEPDILNKTTKNLYEKNKYLHLLKISGYNNTLKTLFEDFSEFLIDIQDHSHSISLLKQFYVEINRLAREERKWKYRQKSLDNKK